LIDFSDDDEDTDHNNNTNSTKITKDHSQNNSEPSSSVNFPRLPDSLPVGDTGAGNAAANWEAQPPPSYNFDLTKSPLDLDNAKKDNHVRPCLVSLNV
jgi:hypothetical protein